MSYYDNYDKDNLKYEIDEFLENYTIEDLLQVVSRCIGFKERKYVEQIDKEENNDEHNV